MKRKKQDSKHKNFLNVIRLHAVALRRQSRRSIVASIGSALLSMTLAACGGSNTASDAPLGNGETELAAAATSSGVTSSPLALSLKMKTDTIRPESEIDSFIVKYKTGTAERGSAQAVQTKLDRLASTFPAKARHARRLGSGADVIRAQRKLSGNEAKAFMRAIAADPDVLYVEPDIVVSGAAIPNDPYFADQWGLLSNLDSGQQSAGIRIANAWNLSTGTGVTIGLVDNGVTRHDDLDANMSAGGVDFTFLPGPADGTNPGRTVENSSCPVTWHGTHVAGILSAVTNNGIGVAGVAPSAKLLSIRVLNACNLGSLSSVADGMVWAAGGSVPGWPMNLHPATVINASLGSGGQCSRTYQDAIDTVNSLGAVVVAAAMNDDDTASNSQPANCHGVIAVGNTRGDGTRGYLSNYGPTVDISAPGTDILSTYNNGTSAVGSQSYASISGTSMAAPMVSGVVALIKSVAPKSLSIAEMRTLIAQHAQAFSRQPDQPMGAGIIDATAAILAAKAGEVPVAAEFKCTQSSVGMTVTCSDLSTARGSASIKSWAWNFGSSANSDQVGTHSFSPSYEYEYPGTYDVTLTITDSNGSISRLARPLTVAAPEATVLTNDRTVQFSAKAHVVKSFKVDVPPGMQLLNVNLSNRSSFESGTMYVKAGSPSTINAACVAPFKGNVAACYLRNPAPGTYYISVSPDTDLDGDNIAAIYMPYQP